MIITTTNRGIGVAGGYLIPLGHQVGSYAAVTLVDCSNHQSLRWLPCTIGHRYTANRAFLKGALQTRYAKFLAVRGCYLCNETREQSARENGPS